MFIHSGSVTLAGTGIQKRKGSLASYLQEGLRNTRAPEPKLEKVRRDIKES